MIHRDLHDGASYDLVASVPGHAGLAIQDADGDRAVVTLDRAGVRRLVDDLQLAAGLAPTPATAGAAAALAGAVRRNFELLALLDRTDPAAVDAIVAAMLSHLRSWRPMLLSAGMVAP